MWKFKQSARFKKDFKKYRNDKDKLAALLDVLSQLRECGKVKSCHKPHRLKGDYLGCLECHVKNDFLLIWIDGENQLIKLIRIGSHSELFSK